METPAGIPVSIQIICSLSGVIAAVVIPIVLAIIGQRYARAHKEKEIGAKFVELALAQLQSTPNPGDANVRQWAVEIIDKYSSVPLPKATQEDLVKRVSLMHAREVRQSEDPFDTKIGTVHPGAGNAQIEKRAYEVASPGKQLGLLSEVVLEMAARGGGPDSDTVKELRAVQRRIEAIKAQQYGVADQDAMANVMAALGKVEVDLKDEETRLKSQQLCSAGPIPKFDPDSA